MVVIFVVVYDVVVSAAVIAAVSGQHGQTTDDPNLAFLRPTRQK